MVYYDTNMSKRILIINPFGIGDVLFSTPLVSVLKQKLHSSYIGYICNIRTKEVLETNPDIAEVFVFERDEYRSLWKKSKKECIKKLFNFWCNIKEKKFDIVIDLSLGKEYAFLCFLVGIKERRGFNYKNRGRFLTYKIPFNGFNDRAVASYYLGLIDPDHKSGKYATVLKATDSDNKYIDDFLKKKGIKREDILVGIAPGGGASYGKNKGHYKRWGYEKFGAVADKLASAGFKPILLWGPGEEESIKDIEMKMQNKPIIGPKTKIREMACLIKRCKIVVCNDGGLLHVAVSQDVPTVSIFGPTDEKVYGPYPPSKKHIVLKSNIDCRPCYKRFKLPDCETIQCMEDVSVDSVFNAVSKLINQEKS